MIELAVLAFLQERPSSEEHRDSSSHRRARNQRPSRRAPESRCICHSAPASPGRTSGSGAIALERPGAGPGSSTFAPDNPATRKPTRTAARALPPAHPLATRGRARAIPALPRYGRLPARAPASASAGQLTADRGARRPARRHHSHCVASRVRVEADSAPMPGVHRNSSPHRISLFWPAPSSQVFAK